MATFETSYFNVVTGKYKQVEVVDKRLKTGVGDTGTISEIHLYDVITKKYRIINIIDKALQLEE